ncbi:MAG: radical SAM protein [Thermodesulfovibrionales bacterium]|nr:radical SAM protein [Thermodesulfovibrionales bacterium]
MRTKLVLINPYIFDFSAYNLWSYPLGLLKTAEFLTSYEVDINFIDCLQTERYKKYHTGKYHFEKVDKPDILKGIKRIYKKYGISDEIFLQKLNQLYPFDLILITSIMAYWYPGIQRVVELIRDNYKDIPIILGGIYPTLYREHALENSGADAICIGQSEKSLVFLINSFGFNLKKKRAKITPFYKLGYPNLQYFAPILTSYGCPFRCTYCASGLLNYQFVQRPVSEVVDEIKWFHNHNFTDIAFYDDALLVNADNHLKVILNYVVKEKIKINFHCPNGLHACFIDKEMAQLMKRSGFKTIRIGFETINKDRQSQTGGKTNEDDLLKAIQNLKSVGFTKDEIGVYLMYGLIGQGFDEVIEGIKFLKGLQVKIHLTEYSPIKGTPMWTEFVEKGIIKDNLDPLLTNNTIFSELFSDYSFEVIQKVKNEVKEYNAQ